MVKIIPKESTYPIRHAVLRKGQGRETAIFTDDWRNNALHLGAFEGDKLVSVASFFYQNHWEYAKQKGVRLRGMATLDEVQGKGYGGAILDFASKHFRNKAEYIWCNARIKAVPFYEKNHFLSIGEEFDIVGIGGHFQMFKIDL